eukprot:TRINITY_DN1699_c0_g1_i2.p1 TRINITY_DN1699_c0_g1~~TRINITY_DN1699_c0_g1_i2.p1  ORF type:complete len:1611 (-),score=547.76 TRINITY_DN1699_c0_g1_i2:290-4978(-)
MSVERIYQKKSQLEHILLRPDTYIGSVQTVTEQMWVWEEGKPEVKNEEGETTSAATQGAMQRRDTTYVPGFYKIFDEILVNAADNKQRDPKMDTLKIEINPEENYISVMNNGKGIPVVMHKEEKMYVPTMIFGHLLTGSNFNDEDEKVTGGRNGFGAKLCNVFSTKFIVETADKTAKKSFKQTWGANMSKTSEPKIKDFSGEEYTKITFNPDLEKFGMSKIDDDTLALLSRRAYDIAASTKGVKVFLNGKRLPVKGFKDYVDLFIKGKEDETGNQLKCVYEQCGDRWEVAICVSDNGHQQMSFVNSIATIKGGRHVDHVADAVIKSIIDNIKKKNKTGINIKPFQIKNHLWIFVNCLIVNPTFDSQTKDTMTLVAKSFGSKCILSEKFQQGLNKSGIIESVLLWSKFKADSMLKSKQSGKKTNKIRGIAKLEDANEAGTKNSVGCTLILTEGDSAKTLAVAGLGVIGRDYYGVYPLKGKLLNVREASHKQIMENKEINDLVKICGLTYKKKYETIEDLKSLRYGKIMIMTDQDQDGSHIKGLLINFIHHNWPSLLKLPFLEEFITPIVKVTKGNQSQCFYSLPEFQEWKEDCENWALWKVKYYKGLGTSTSKEAKEYFSDMVRHKIKFNYNGDQDDRSIELAFSKKAVDQRKEWLTNWMEEGKRRKELGLPEVYLYEKDTRAVNYSDFVNKELVLFSNMDNERSIPSLVDGLKPGQRKVIYTCLKRNLTKKEIKVAQLAGSVAEISAYHHGEASLMGTIINLAQNYIGSNNINLLQPIGQFGTRLSGGKDSASPRYIFTQMSPLARNLFNENDDAVLNYLLDDNQKIEPEWYIPIIPMVLVNGADGIGTGWMTKVPNYNPREIVKNLKKMLAGEEAKPMTPWFKNFRGTIEPLDHQRYVVNGEVSSLSDTKIEITELPVKTWTNSYKEMLEGMLTGNEKAPALIQDYKDYNTDTTVKFIVQMTEDSIRKAETEKGLHTFFKLQTTMSCTSMVLFDSLGCLRKYENVQEIMKEFFDLRLTMYGKRKKNMEGTLGAEACKLSNQARFILEKCDGTLKIENKKKKIMIEELSKRGYDSDPVKAWKKSQETHPDAEEEDEDEDGEPKEVHDGKGPDFDYLLGMPMWNLTQEKKDSICKNRDLRNQELKKLQATTMETMWKTDLDEFVTKLDEVETKERKEVSEADADLAKLKKAKGKNSKSMMKMETQPSAHAIRVAPVIADELKIKASKAVAAKERKAKGGDVKKVVKKEKDEFDEFDAMSSDKALNKSLSGKLGQTPDGIVKKKRAPKGTGTPKKRGEKKKNPWSDSDASGGDVSGSDMSDAIGPIEVAPRQRAGGKRAAAAKATFKFDDSEESDKSGSDDELHDNDGIKEKKITSVAHSDESDVDEPSSPPKKASPQKPAAVFQSESEDDAPHANGNGHAVNGDDSGSDFDVPKPAAKKPAAKKPAKKLNTSDDLFDNMMDEDAPAKKAAPKKAAAKKKKAASDDDDAASDFEEPKPKKAAAKKPAAKKPAAKKPPAKKPKYDSDQSGSDFDMDDVPARKPAGAGRQKKAINYGGDDGDESDF